MTKKTLARDANHSIAAEQMKSLYDEYILAGFSEAQALELIKTILGVGIEHQQQ